MKHRMLFFFLAGCTFAIIFLFQRELHDTPTEEVAAKPMATATVTESATPTLKPSPTNEPPTPSPTPRFDPTATPDIFTGVNRFNYGAQINWTNIDNNQEMIWITQMGFKWAKAQIRWCNFEKSRGNIDFGQMDQLINAANGKGINVMFGVVCAPNWSRADGGRGGSGPPDDMQKAADFMGTLAGKYCGGALSAIEVWNEHNLIVEWHGKPISAASYMDLLSKSFKTIKSKCLSILVISGAPAPNGLMTNEAIDDKVFLQQMYANGLKQYSDAIGAHPSGFCNEPDARVGNSNPCGGQYNSHRSFFMLETLENYRAVMVANGDGDKQIWPTEFGWGVDPSPKPGYDYEKALNEDTQAKWLVQAYQIMKQKSYIGVAFLWNLDFLDMGNETGAFHVQGRSAQGALGRMPK